MSLRKIFSVVFLALSFISARAGQGDVIKDIENAISMGNSKTLALYFNNTLELETPQAEGIYSKSQAEQIIFRLFNKYPPTSFSFTHTGNSVAGSSYAVGNYVSGSETFRVTVMVKKVGNEFLIQEIKFE